MTIAEKAVVADALKRVRQNMQQESGRAEIYVVPFWRRRWIGSSLRREGKEIYYRRSEICSTIGVWCLGCNTSLNSPGPALSNSLQRMSLL